MIGLTNVLEEEERIANAISDSVSPLLIPSLQLHTWRDRDLLLISVPHTFGPYYIKSKGLEEGTYVRFGSTNRLVDATTILEIQRLKEHKYFDEQPNFDCAINEINFDLAKELLAKPPIKKLRGFAFDHLLLIKPLIRLVGIGMGIIIHLTLDLLSNLQ